MTPTPAVRGVTPKLGTGCGPLYPHLLEAAPWFLVDGPGKAGGCAAAQVSALAALVGYALELGGTRAEIAARLTGIRCQHSNPTLGALSCSEAVAEALRDAQPDGLGGKP